MKYKTLFRLGLRLIGVYFFFLGVVGMPASVVGVWAMIGDPTAWSFPGKSGWIQAVVWYSTAVVQLIVGLYLFFGGKWIVNRAIPSNRLYCHECGYMLEGIKGERCPECDTPFRSVGSITDGAGATRERDD